MDSTTDETPLPSADLIEVENGFIDAFIDSFMMGNEEETHFGGLVQEDDSIDLSSGRIGIDNTLQGEIANEPGDQRQGLKCQNEILRKEVQVDVQIRQAFPEETHGGVHLDEVEECQESDQEAISEVESLQYDEENETRECFPDFGSVYSNVLVEECELGKCFPDFDPMHSNEFGGNPCSPCASIPNINDHKLEVDSQTLGGDMFQENVENETSSQEIQKNFDSVPEMNTEMLASEYPNCKTNLYSVVF